MKMRANHANVRLTFSYEIGCKIEHLIFQKEGLPVPDYVVLPGRDEPGFASMITQDLIPPFVVKPAQQGSSIGLAIVQTKKELEESVRRAFDIDQRVIIEEYIPGKEIAVGILGDSALPVIEIIPQNRFYNYEAKYKPGKANYVVPAVLSAQVIAQVQAKALTAHKLLGCSGFS